MCNPLCSATGRGDAAGRVPVLLQLRHEPRAVRVPLRELQEVLFEGVHVRYAEGRQRGAARGELGERTNGDGENLDWRFYITLNYIT